jgi:hypothetical protein
LYDPVLQISLQVVTALAVAGGFVYAALQFRGWRTAQYVANFTKLVELQLQLRKMVVDDPTLAPIGLSMPADRSPDELRSYFYNLMQLSLFEIAWFGYTNGQLPKDYFDSWLANISLLSKRKSFHTMWRSDTTKIMHAGFRHYMDGLMKEPVVLTPDEKLAAHKHTK